MSDKEKSKGQELLDLWNELEEGMGEMAAYDIACQQLGIDPDDGWGLLAEVSEETQP